MILFKNRKEAGEKLARKLEQYKEKNVLVLAIPRGGVAIGYEIAKVLKADFDLIIPRKIPIPWNSEAGFGAVIISDKKTIVLNEELVRQLGLSKTEIQRLVKKVFKEVKRRNQEYRKNKPFPLIKGRIVVLVDDGLATGFTVLAAIRAIKEKEPAKIIVAAPVSPQSSFNLIKKEVDELVVLYVQPWDDFAVASFYQDFSEVSDEEVKEYLRYCYYNKKKENLINVTKIYNLC